MLVDLWQAWWTFRKLSSLSSSKVASTSPTRRHSTRRARVPCMPRERSVMTGGRKAMVSQQHRFSAAKTTEAWVDKLHCRSKRILTQMRWEHCQLGGDERKGQIIQFILSRFCYEDNKPWGYYSLQTKRKSMATGWIIWTAGLAVMWSLTSLLQETGKLSWK